MYKFILLSFIFICSANAQEIQDFDWQKTVKEKLSAPGIQEMLTDGFSVNDVNGDGFISENEYGYLLNSIDIDFSLNDEQKSAKKSRMTEYFKQADKNGDFRLDKDEYFAVLQKETEYEAKERVNKIQEMANKSPEEILKDLNEQMDKTKKALEKFQNVSADEMSDNIISNISGNIAGENYFQMDKNKDGCVTEDEYVEYMTVFASDNKEDEGKYPKLSEDDWRNIYQFEKKSKENCLTKEEYMRNYLETPDMSVVESDTADSELLTDKKVVK